MTIDERVREIYRTYNEVICPYVLEYELLSGKFPTEILNEIRSILTHLSKCFLSDDNKIKESNIIKAEGHIKRTILDCYKYICITYDDEYKAFERKYRYTDLSLIYNGEFLPELLESRKNAVKLMKDARKSDLAINSDDVINCDEAYKKYEDAFVAYSSIYNHINNSYKKLENLRKKTLLKNIFAIGGWIISIILAIVSIFY